MDFDLSLLAVAPADLPYLANDLVLIVVSTDGGWIASGRTVEEKDELLRRWWASGDVLLAVHQGVVSVVPVVSYGQGGRILGRVRLDDTTPLAEVS